MDPGWGVPPPNPGKLYFLAHSSEAFLNVGLFGLRSLPGEELEL